MAVEGESNFEPQSSHAQIFLRTETLTGNASTQKIRSILESMKESGWVGPPIHVVEIRSEKYIINGHHRVFAARRANILVHFRVITEAELIQYRYRSTDEVIQAHVEAGPNRIYLR